MSPRKLDWRAIEPKLTMINRLLDQLTELGEFDEARLGSDWPNALAAERILGLLVDLAVSVNNHVSVARLRESPPDYKKSFEFAARAGLIDDKLARALAPSTSMRNVLIHAYLEIDYAKIALSIPLALEHYREYVRQVAAWLRVNGQQT